MDHALLGAEPAQMAVMDESAPEPAEVVLRDGFVPCRMHEPRRQKCVERRDGKRKDRRQERDARERRDGVGRNFLR